jgi:hypothetical protein
MRIIVQAIAATLLLSATAAQAFPRYHYSVPKATTYHYKAPKLGPSYRSGYVTKSGTYVQPHYQTAPNRTKVDNWSSKPNVNPFTGKAGTKDPYSAGH